jgi:hypothetical protein
MCRNCSRFRFDLTHSQTCSSSENLIRLLIRPVREWVDRPKYKYLVVAEVSLGPCLSTCQHVGFAVVDERAKLRPFVATLVGDVAHRQGGVLMIQLRECSTLATSSPAHGGLPPSGLRICANDWLNEV